MRTAVSQIQQVIGCDAESEASVRNVRWDPVRKWWVNDRGWQGWTQYRTDTYHQPNSLYPTRSLYSYTRGAGEQYILTERGGDIWSQHGNNGEDVNARETLLVTDREPAGAADPGVSFVEYGRFLLAIDGRNQPVMLSPDSARKSVPFGFRSPPTAPIAQQVDPTLLNGLITTGTGTGAQTDTSAVGVLGLVPPLLGDYTEDADNSYEWRVSFVSHTGSESPMSAPASSRWSNGTAPAASTFAVMLTLPECPESAVAIRVYRTKNMGDGSGVQDRTYYFVSEIPAGRRLWMDTISDTRLTISAPDPTLIRSLPPGCSAGTSYDGRLWLGGGSHNPSTLWYSEQGLCEQFHAFSFLGLGGAGGVITALRPFGGNLIVFRERSIEVVRTTEQLLYAASTLSATVGCVAPKTITEVPGLGLVFLSGSDIYALTDKLEIISGPVAEELAKINGYAVRACATYAHADREFVLAFPADGGVECTRAVVYHVAAGLWSLRYLDPSSTEQLYRWSITAMCADPGGRLLATMAPMSPDLSRYPGQVRITDIAEGDRIEGLGIWVWCASGASGEYLTLTGVTPSGDAAGFTGTYSEAPKASAMWRSGWHEFDTLTQVVSVEVWMVNASSAPLTVQYAVDGRDEWTDGPACEVAQFETNRTASADHVYADDVTAQRYKYLATWGTSKWREDRPVRVRWDISLSRLSAQSVAVRIVSAQPFGVQQYRLSIGPTTKQVSTTKR